MKRMVLEIEDDEGHFRGRGGGYYVRGPNGQETK